MVDISQISTKNINMAQKFSFVVEVKSGKPVGTVFNKDEAHKAKELFEKFRNEGKEAYYFQSPNHDKRSKSEEQITASAAGVPVEAEKSEPAEEVVSKSSKKNSVLGF